MRKTLTVAFLLAFAASAAAQSNPAPAPSTPSVDCRAQAQSKGLRGQDMRDAVQICVQEQRLACIKEAVEKKIVGPARREFMKTCAGRPDDDDNSNNNKK